MNAPLAKEQIALLMSDSLTYRAPVVEGTDGTIADPRPGLFDKIRAFFAAIAELPHRRAVIDELSMLTDRELADIGLSRSQLGQVFNPRFQARRG
jgi:uncharacterized protein YjiS (DUF1127 family)